MTDLKQLSVKELFDLSKEALALAEAKKDREKGDLRMALVSQIRAAGYEVEDIFPGTSVITSKPRTKSQARYRHPEIPTLTWSGKGRKPNWLLEQQAAGRALSEFLIETE